MSLPCPQMGPSSSPDLLQYFLVTAWSRHCDIGGAPSARRTASALYHHTRPAALMWYGLSVARRGTKGNTHMIAHSEGCGLTCHSPPTSLSPPPPTLPITYTHPPRTRPVILLDDAHITRGQWACSHKTIATNMTAATCRPRNDGHANSEAQCKK